jgi:hypothetical protein
MPRRRNLCIAFVEEVCLIQLNSIVVIYLNKGETQGALPFFMGHLNAGVDAVPGYLDLLEAK